MSQFLIHGSMLVVSKANTGVFASVYSTLKSHLYAGITHTLTIMSFVSHALTLITGPAYVFSNHNILYILPDIVTFCEIFPLLITLNPKESLPFLSTVALIFESVVYSHPGFLSNLILLFIDAAHPTKKSKKYTLRVITLNICHSFLEFVNVQSI
ncbi:MAG: hypothetical protein WCL02_05025 [bacterium]